MKAVSKDVPEAASMVVTKAVPKASTKAILMDPSKDFPRPKQMLFPRIP